MGNGKAKILLMSLNTETMPHPVYPLGMACVAGALNRDGYDVVQFDLMASGGRSPVEYARQCNPDLAGISIRNVDNQEIRGTTDYISPVIDTVRDLKSALNVPVILGGSAFSLFPEEIMERTGADGGVVGAGEDVVSGLVRDILDGRIPPGPQKGSGDFSARPVRNPDILAYYLENAAVLNARTQQGCPFRCIYCTYPSLEGRRHEPVSMEIIMDDLGFLKESGARFVFVADSVINSTRDHVLSFAQALIDEKINIRWGGFFTPRGLSEEDYGLLAESGLTHVEFGTDTLCESTLNEYRKPFSVGEVIEANQAAVKNRINVCHYLIFGGPGETMQTARETMENALRLEKAVIMPFFGIRLYPCTMLLERAIEEGVVEKDRSLIKPRFYFSSGAGIDDLEKLVHEKAGNDTRWLFPEQTADLNRQMQYLRKKGKSGPLWEYAPYRNMMMDFEKNTG